MAYTIPTHWEQYHRQGNRQAYVGEGAINMQHKPPAPWPVQREGATISIEHEIINGFSARQTLYEKGMKLIT